MSSWRRRRVGVGVGRIGLLPCAAFAGLWAMCASALVLIFGAQETLEGIFATGHPARVRGRRLVGDSRGGGHRAHPRRRLPQRLATRTFTAVV
jgi:hypothetical protein